MYEEIDAVLIDLEKYLKKFLRTNKPLKHLMRDSFVDHKGRYKSDLQIISKFCNKKGRILDVGSAPCHLIYCLSKLGYNVVGLDIDPSVVGPFLKENKLVVIKCDLEVDTIPFKRKSFDFIIFNEIFEHLKIDPIGTLKKIHSLLKPGGLFILTTPNLYSIHKIIMFNLGMSFNNAYFEFKKMEKYGYMGHIREYSTKEMRLLLEEAGFKIIKVLYRNYSRFSDNNLIKKMRLVPLAYGLDLFSYIVPKLRFSQVIICKS